MFSLLHCCQIYKPVCIAVFWSRLKTTHTLNCFCFGDWGSVLNFQHLFQPPIKKEPHPTFKYPSVWLIPIMFIAMCDIRKDTTKGQTNDTDRTAGEVRRSRRDRVPNNKYAEGIEQLRRVSSFDKCRLLLERTTSPGKTKLSTPMRVAGVTSGWMKRKSVEQSHLNGSSVCCQTKPAPHASLMCRWSAVGRDLREVPGVQIQNRVNIQKLESRGEQSGDL